MQQEVFTCVIVDDDKFSSETMADLLSDYSNIKVLKLIDDAETAIKHIAILQPNLVFLDINMPQKDGLLILNEINELKLSCQVIFTTAYKEYLLDALKKNAFDYLIKPVSKNELDETIQRFTEKTEAKEEQKTEKPADNDEEKNAHKILIKNAHGTLIISPPEVAFIQADGCYSVLNFTNQKTEVLSKNLGKIEKHFPDNTFFKISRSTIINTHYINRIDRVKKMVHIVAQGKEYKLKASKERLLDLESLINRSR